MSGLLDIPYPVFDAVDGWVAAVAPAWLRLVLWGAVSGAAAMALYAATSSQDRLQALKRRSAELRAEVARTEDAGEAARLALQNVRLSFRFLGAVLGPALLSGIPVLFLLAWVSAAYSYAMPEAGRTVPVVAAPPDSGLTMAPPVTGEAMAVAWPGTGGTVTLRERDAILDAPADELRLGIIHKRRWWNWLLGNEAGYLPAAWATDSVSFALPPREVLSFGPAWMRGWAFVYFVTLVAVSLVIKLRFRIV